MEIETTEEKIFKILDKPMKNKEIYSSFKKRYTYRLS